MGSGGPAAAEEGLDSPKAARTVGTRPACTRITNQHASCVSLAKPTAACLIVHVLVEKGQLILASPFGLAIIGLPRNACFPGRPPASSQALLTVLTA